MRRNAAVVRENFTTIADFPCKTEMKKFLDVLSLDPDSKVSVHRLNVSASASAKTINRALKESKQVDVKRTYQWEVEFPSIKRAQKFFEYVKGDRSILLGDIVLTELSRKMLTDKLNSFESHHVWILLSEVLEYPHAKEAPFRVECCSE
jgi:hypothetical protein